MEAIDVIEHAVVGLRHDRQRPVGLGIGLELPRHDGIPHNAHAIRIGDQDRPGEEARFLHPGRPCHLPVAVERKPGGKYRVLRILAARQHCGDAGADRSLPDHQRAIAGDEGGVSHHHVTHVRDGIIGTRCSVERDTEIACARLGLGRHELRGSQKHAEDEGE
jgi:hypothetical protein